MTAIKLWDAGYTDLVSVIPPDATISPTSSIGDYGLGKIPGVKKADGTWVGYSWLKADPPSREKVQQWEKWGANIGILGTRFPAIDIDVDNENLAKFVLHHLNEDIGAAPIRRSRGARRLAVVRTDTPFERQALLISYGEEKHVVEVLGDGRQYLLSGTHPSGAEYRWEGAPLWETAPGDLPSVTREQIVDFLHALADKLNAAGIEGLSAAVDVTRQREQGDAPPQEDLLAPSMETLARVVGMIPNTFPDREQYIQFGCAVKAAAGEDDDGGLGVFQEWASRWEGGKNDPNTVASDWARMHPPFRVGWTWLQDVAAQVSEYEPAADAFSVVAEAPPEDGERDADDVSERVMAGVLDHTDTWVVEKIVSMIEERIRYVPGTGQWHVWDGHTWVRDERNLAEHTIRRALTRLSEIWFERAKAHPVEEKREALFKFAAKLQSRHALTKAVPEIQAHPTITLTLEDFDANPWVLNTPGGIVNLHTGAITPPDPGALLSKTTKCAPLHHDGVCAATAQLLCGSLWGRFLEETTGGDSGLQRFLQKQVGYALTGVTTEQSLCFIHGPPLTGKSVFTDTVAEIFGSYHETADPETFALSRGERHPTDLAKLAGSRLVTTVETQEGRSWNTQRVKAVTGGDRMTARFMRQDLFEFKPTFKVVMVGNYEPVIKGVDDALMRRLHIIPFVHGPTPDNRDRNLPAKLQEEAPLILAWAIEGCLLWQEEGLEPPAVVVERTKQYQEEEDPISAFIRECCEFGDPEYEVSRMDLYHRWQQWCREQGEEAGSLKMLKRRMDSKANQFGISDTRLTGESRTDRPRGYRGLALKDIDYEEII